MTQGIQYSRKRPGLFRKALRRWTAWFLELRNPGGAWMSRSNQLFEDFDISRNRALGCSAALSLCRLLVDTDSDEFCSIIRDAEFDGVLHGDFRVFIERIPPEEQGSSHD